MTTQHKPARPDTWEVPDLKNQSSFFIKPLSLRNEIPARLLDILTSSELADDQAHSRRIETFLRSVVHFGHHEDWEAHRLLGRGGFGTVGLWVRRDASNEIVDELAIKEQSASLGQAQAFSRYEEPGLHSTHGVLAEAVIQKQLNEYACENILHLRGYSFVTNSDPRPSQSGDNGSRWATGRGNAGHGAGQVDTDSSSSDSADTTEIYRMYTEFSPYQTLTELRDQYRNWRRYLPEPFLWHLFDSLAAAAQILEKGPQRKFSSTGLTRWTVQKWPEDWGVVHFDIKPGNIFLGYEMLKDEASTVTGGSRILGYPVIKVSDYGLSKITGPGDADNPKDYLGRGTRHYRPPEQTQYGAEWRSPPNGRARPLRTRWGTPYPVSEIHRQEAHDPHPGWLFGSPANVWNIGKVMYDLVTISRSATIDRKILIHNNTEGKYVSNGHHFIDQDSWNSIPFQRACESNHLPLVPYSPALMELVRECLRPAINMRIKPDDLRKATQAGLARAEHNLDPANAGRQPPDKPAASSKSRLARSPTFKPPKLFCRANEINDMPAGNTRFTRQIQDDYFRMMRRTWQDPDWPTLNPPRAIWGDMMDQYGTKEDPEPHNYHIAHGRICFGLPPRTQTPAPAPANDNAPSGNSVNIIVDDNAAPTQKDPMVYDIDNLNVSGATLVQEAGSAADQLDDGDDVSMSDLPSVRDILHP